MLIALSAVLSLVTIISIYREGGILKRLRATPLRPQTILTAHVMVKLMLTAVTLALMVLAGKRYYPVDIHAPLFGFHDRAADQHLEHLVDRLSHRQHRSHGALRATDRRRHLYPMMAVSGLFVPVDSLPPSAQAVARVLPLTYAVSLLEGIWKGDAWSAHVRDVAALAVVFLACTALSAKVFRWE